MGLLRGARLRSIPGDVCRESVQCNFREFDFGDCSRQEVLLKPLPSGVAGLSVARCEGVVSNPQGSGCDHCVMSNRSSAALSQQGPPQNLACACQVPTRMVMRRLSRLPLKDIDAQKSIARTFVVSGFGVECARRFLTEGRATRTCKPRRLITNLPV